MNNQITIEGDIARIALSQGYVAIIDAVDVDLISQYRWFSYVTRRRRDGSISHVYALTNVIRSDGKRRTQKLHRMLMNPPEDMDIDHRDGDGLNNRRGNLRICTHADNMHNMRTHVDSVSGCKGVDWSKHAKKWRARIQVNGKYYHLGYFATSDDAAHAYDAAAVALQGDYAWLNAPAA